MKGWLTHKLFKVSLLFPFQDGLIPLLSRNVGSGMGLEFREGTHVLHLPGSGKATAAGENGGLRVRAGMVFNVCLGVTGLTNRDVLDAKAKNYALQVRNEFPVCLVESVLMCGM